MKSRINMRFRKVFPRGGPQPEIVVHATMGRGTDFFCYAANDRLATMESGKKCFTKPGGQALMREESRARLSFDTM